MKKGQKKGLVQFVPIKLWEVLRKEFFRSNSLIKLPL
jgi:hypothetical protein